MIERLPLMNVVIASCTLSLVFIGEISLSQKEFNQYSKLLSDQQQMWSSVFHQKYFNQTIHNHSKLIKSLMQEEELVDKTLSRLNEAHDIASAH